MAKTTKNASDITVLGTDAEAFRKAFTDHIHHTLARSKYTVTDHEKQQIHGDGPRKVPRCGLRRA